MSPPTRPCPDSHYKRHGTCIKKKKKKVPGATPYVRPTQKRPDTSKSIEDWFAANPLTADGPRLPMPNRYRIKKKR